MGRRDVRADDVKCVCERCGVEPGTVRQASNQTEAALICNEPSLIHNVKKKNGTEALSSRQSANPPNTENSPGQLQKWFGKRFKQDLLE